MDEEYTDYRERRKEDGALMELNKKMGDDPKPSLLGLCESLFMLAINGDYSNGIEAFGVDEGRVRAGELLTKYENALKDCRIRVVLGECCCGANR